MVKKIKKQKIARTEKDVLEDEIDSIQKTFMEIDNKSDDGSKKKKKFDNTPNN